MERNSNKTSNGGIGLDVRVLFGAFVDRTTLHGRINSQRRGFSDYWRSQPWMCTTGWAEGFKSQFIRKH
jgi:hypothetical protein